MNLSAGDARIIMFLYAFRFLTTGMLALLTGRDPQLIRRALRKRLRPGGFVASFNRLPAEEGAFTLGPAGLAFVAHELGCTVNDLPFPRKVTTHRSFLFRHTLSISEVRVLFTLATAADASPVILDRSIAEWETVPSSPPNAALHTRFVLAERLVGDDGVAYAHRPDCVLLCYPKAVGRAKLVALAVELDRNTESITRRIAAKYESYWLYWRERRHVQAFDAVALRVLFILDDVRDRKRIQSMQAELSAFAQRKSGAAEVFRRCFRFVRKSDLRAETLLANPVFFDADDRPRRFFQDAQGVHDAPDARRPADTEAP